MNRSYKVSGSEYFSIAMFLILVLIAWTIGLFFISADADQGDAYRIIFVHVPSAFTAFICAFKLLFLGVIALKKRRAELLPAIKATSQMGLIFTGICLATGSIWGKTYVECLVDLGPKTYHYSTSCNLFRYFTNRLREH